MPDIALRSVDELTPHEWSAWRAIRAATPSLDSPYFAPELIQALSTGRPACRVAVLRRRSEIVGFFPFETNNLGLGRPIGGRLSDYHGPILPDGERIDAVDLVRRSGLISFAFEHIPATRTEFADHAQTTRPSHSLDVSHGFEAYRQERRAAKSDAGDDLRGAVKRVISVSASHASSGTPTVTPCSINSSSGNRNSTPPPVTPTHSPPDGFARHSNASRTPALPSSRGFCPPCGWGSD